MWRQEVKPLINPDKLSRVHTNFQKFKSLVQIVQIVPNRTKHHILIIFGK